jgi:Tfp pilus assembly protein PilO
MRKLKIGNWVMLAVLVFRIAMGGYDFCIEHYSLSKEKMNKIEENKLNKNEKKKKQQNKEENVVN